MPQYKCIRCIQDLKVLPVFRLLQFGLTDRAKIAIGHLTETVTLN